MIGLSLLFFAALWSATLADGLPEIYGPPITTFGVPHFKGVVETVKPVVPTQIYGLPEIKPVPYVETVKTIPVPVQIYGAPDLHKVETPFVAAPIVETIKSVPVPGPIYGVPDVHKFETRYVEAVKPQIIFPHGGNPHAQSQNFFYNSQLQLANLMKKFYQYYAKPEVKVHHFQGPTITYYPAPQPTVKYIRYQVPKFFNFQVPVTYYPQKPVETYGTPTVTTTSEFQVKPEETAVATIEVKPEIIEKPTIELPEPAQIYGLPEVITSATEKVPIHVEEVPVPEAIKPVEVYGVPDVQPTPISFSVSVPQPEVVPAKPAEVYGVPTVEVPNKETTFEVPAKPYPPANVF